MSRLLHTQLCTADEIAIIVHAALAIHALKLLVLLVKLPLLMLLEGLHVATSCNYRSGLGIDDQLGLLHQAR